MLYNRIVQQGTLDEPNGKPDPGFALPATAYWMRSLRMIADDSRLNFSSAESFYQKVQRKSFSSLQENTVFEQLILSLHHLSAIQRLGEFNEPSDAARIGIVAWFYGISNAASAMIAAKDGTFHEDHAGTARVWDRQFAQANLVCEPFGWRISDLTEKAIRREILTLKAGSKGTLKTQPRTVSDARGAAIEYLSGTAAWQKGKSTEDVRQSNDFKNLGVDNFRTLKARDLRDKLLRTKSVCFVHQASRYRGKANYREALFLAYGAKSTNRMLLGFMPDTAAVLSAFLAMAGAYVKRRLGKDLWNEFVQDVEKNRAFSASPYDVWK